MKIWGDNCIDFVLMQCSKLAVVRSSETTKKFTGQPGFGKIKRLVARGIYKGQPSQTEKIN